MSVVEMVLMSVVEIVGDFALKEYANGGASLYLFIGILGYIGVVTILIIALKGSTVLLVNAAWDGTSALIESLAAIILLGERFEHKSQYAGVVLIVCGLYMLKLPITRSK
jgi:multidrug transporter EmrE-like cation transporter